MRPATAQARLLITTLALAIAVPTGLPSWTAAGDDAGPASVARRPAGVAVGSSWQRPKPRVSFHAASLVAADPSDEPGEGGDDWTPPVPRGLFVPGALPGLSATQVGMTEPPPSIAACPPRVACRLRC